jgi:hypothetical protein
VAVGPATFPTELLKMVMKYWNMKVYEKTLSGSSGSSERPPASEPMDIITQLKMKSIKK